MQTRVGIILLCGFCFWWGFQLAVGMDWTGDPEEARGRSESSSSAARSAGYEWGYVYAVPMFVGIGMAVGMWQVIKHLRHRTWVRAHPFLVVTFVVVALSVVSSSILWPR